MHITGTSFTHPRTSSKNKRNQSASSAHLSRAIKSDSIVDLTTIVCLEDFYAIDAPSKLNTHPFVDFESFISYILFASAVHG